MLNIVTLLLAVLVERVAECSSIINIDLGYEVNENSMRWVTSGPFSKQTQMRGYTEKGYWYESYEFCSPEHLGTHLDAPSHFAYDRWSVTDIPLDHLIGQGVVVDIRDKVEEDPAAELTSDDLRMWMEKYGPLPDGAIVFVLTGWGSRYGNKTAYYGTPTNDTTKLVFPGISPGAAQLLTEYEQSSGQRVFGVGIDTASLDHGPSVKYETHIIICEANIYGLENVANLEKLPTRGFEVTVMPIKITGGSGGPARIVARIPEQTTDTIPSTSSQPLPYFMILLLIATSLRLL